MTAREHWASGGRSSRNLAGESPGPGGWQGRGEESASRAQGQARLPLPGELATGASPPHSVWSRQAYHLGKLGQEKIRITRQNKTAFPSSPPSLGVGAGEETGPERAPPGPKPGLWLPRQCSCCSIWPHPPGPGVVGKEGLRSLLWSRQGEARPPLSDPCHLATLL